MGRSVIEPFHCWIILSPQTSYPSKGDSQQKKEEEEERKKKKKRLKGYGSGWGWNGKCGRC